MKLILITVTLSLACFQSFSQNHFDKYIGQTVVVKKNPNDKEVSGFRKVQDIGSESIPYKLDIGSIRDSLTNKQFKCLAIEEYKGTNWIKLDNLKTGIIYYWFDGNILDTEIIPLFYSEHMADYKALICARIEEDIDDIENSKSFNTPSTLKSTVEAMFFKEITKKGQVSYSLALTVEASTALANERGVTILLANGKRIVKPKALVETEVNTLKKYSWQPDFVRKSLITLSAMDVLLLKTSPIKKFRLYISDGYPPFDSTNLMLMFQCLTTKK